jgi:hypothetical protein
MASYSTAFLNLAKSVHSVEEFSEYIVKNAVTDTIAIISEKYGLDSAALMTELLGSLVARHAHIRVGGERCRAITYRGKKCVHASVDSRGYCQLHSRQQVEEKKKKKKLKRPRKEGDDAVSKVMHMLSSIKKRSQQEDPIPLRASQSFCHRPSPTVQ